MSPHPDTSQLELLAQAGLGAREAAACQEHLAECGPCRRRYEQCFADEQLVGQLRDARATTVSVETPADEAEAPFADADRWEDPDSTLAGGRYSIIGRLGAGGMGAVWVAHDTHLGREVALKRIRSDLAGVQAALRRFLAEAKTIAKLSHPNIVHVYDVGTDQRGDFIVMEYVDGEDLAAQLRTGGAMQVPQAVSIIERLCDALSYAHRHGVVHRDVKPSNILIDRSGTPKLVDFGLATVRSGDSRSPTGHTTTGVAMGTPEYASPEQLTDGKRVDGRTDVYALAATLYQMVTGQSPRQFRESVIPSEIRAVVVKGVEADPDRRFADAESFGRALLGAATMQGEGPSGWRPGIGLPVPGREGWMPVRKLGGGSSGEVWLARHDRTHQTRVFKFCFSPSRLRALKGELALFRLLREALGERLDIARLYEVKLDSAPYYLEIEYAENGSLIDWAAQRDGLHNVPIASRIELVAEVADALAAAHSVGVLHKDLRPSNVLIYHGQNKRPHARLTDFGMAPLPENDAPADGGSGCGDSHRAPLHGAPEVLMGAAPSTRSDIHALGVMLYQVAAGDLDRPLAHGWEARVDDELLREDIIACVAGEPADRLPSADVLARRLRSLPGRRAERQAECRRERRERRMRRVRRVAAVTAPLIVLIAAGAFALHVQRLRLRRAEAGEILTAFGHDPAGALARAAAAGPDVNALLVAAAGRYVSSPAFTERIVGARGSFWLAPLEFWRGVDGGPLWAHGEWLEICRPTWPHRDRLIRMLRGKATDGSRRQKYVAYCLIGQLAGPDDGIADLCAEAVRGESDPGVVAAAKWAAGRLERDVPLPHSDSFFVDDRSGMVFVRVPATPSFRPGSPADQEDRYADEDRPSQPVTVRSLWIGVTEVTLTQYAPFEKTGRLEPECAELLREQIGDTPADRHATTAVHSIRPIDADDFCAWLTENARARGEAIVYRLPDEAEWEYVCRAGNDRAFCYGDDPRNLRYFASCDGWGADCTVAAHMPNPFGVFDMHGNLWEICGSPYREHYAAPADDAEMGRRAQRGGAAYSPAVRCRSAQRNHIPDRQGTEYAGFRVVLEMEARR